MDGRGVVEWPLLNKPYLLMMRKLRGRVPDGGGGDCTPEGITGDAFWGDGSGGGGERVTGGRGSGIGVVRHCFWQDELGKGPEVAARQPFLASPAKQ